MFFPDSVVGVTVESPHLNRYVELCLRRAKVSLEANDPQSAQKNINLNDLRPLLIPVPDPDEQARIVAVYDAFREQVRMANAQLEKLRVTKQGLMDDLLTGRFAGSKKL